RALDLPASLSDALLQPQHRRHVADGREEGSRQRGRQVVLDPERNEQAEGQPAQGKERGKAVTHSLESGGRMAAWVAGIAQLLPQLTRRARRKLGDRSQPRLELLDE